MGTQDQYTSHSLLGVIEQAATATRANPRHPGAWLQLAYAYEQGHQLELALSAAKTAVHLAPSLAVGRVMLGQIELRLRHPEAVCTLQEALAQGVDEDLQVEVYTLIAEHYRSHQQHREAYQNYLSANRMSADRPAVRQLREGPGASHSDGLHGVQAWAELLRTQDLQGWPQAAYPSPEEPRSPIFLIGFPRSGTTLLGRMLAQHDELYVLEEEGTVEVAMQGLRGHPAALPDLRARTPGELEHARRRYWSAVNHFAKGPLPSHIRLIDKMPLNILRIPVLARMFPDSRFILALRDPRDACLSCWMQNFRPTAAMATFVDPEATARYHHACFEVLHTVQSQMEVSVVPVRYEELTADPRRVLQHTLEALDIPWSEAVLEHNKRSRDWAVRTPSYKQVADAIYQHAIGRWQHYPEVVDAMLPWLTANMNIYGYAAG